MRILRAKKHTYSAWEILLDFHPINHPAIAPRIEKHAIGIATMHFEYFWENLFAGFLSHANCARFGVVEADAT